MVPGSQDAFDEDLTTLSDDVRAEAAIDQRRRQRNLARQGAEDGTLAGTLIDLAEHGATVAISTSAGHQVRGQTVAIGADHVAIQTSNGQLAHVVLAAVAVLQVGPETRATSGDRTVKRVRSMSAVLADLVEQRRTVSVHTTSGETITGSLRDLGVDVVRVRSATGRLVYVAQGAITVVTLY